MYAEKLGIRITPRLMWRYYPGFMLTNLDKKVLIYDKRAVGGDPNLEESRFEVYPGSVRFCLILILFFDPKGYAYASNQENT